MGDARTEAAGRWLRQRIIPCEAATRRALAAAMGAVLLGSGVALAVRAQPRSPLLASAAVGSAPSAIAVDPRSGHVFVATVYGTPPPTSVASRLVAWSRPWLPAWGQRWLSKLAQAALPLRTPPGTVTVLDPSRL